MEPAQGEIAQVRIENVPIIAAREVNGRWFIQFQGSWELLCIGDNIENWSVGDRVDIIIRKRNALPR